ncbi:MAG: hypothetical protein EZS28_032877 [Streblomastix strix]|uniref:Uncharacterized protein n=1 Tax=Streblomastix strix TaxID=222440 RepID=A0A5J4UPC3_9EUKA|nr:MAG: hypothetical protein EZS28_032877 [Streblomastix strix]
MNDTSLLDEDIESPLDKQYQREVVFVLCLEDCISQTVGEIIEGYESLALIRGLFYMGDDLISGYDLVLVYLQNESEGEETLVDILVVIEFCLYEIFQFLFGDGDVHQEFLRPNYGGYNYLPFALGERERGRRGDPDEYGSGECGEVKLYSVYFDQKEMIEYLLMGQIAAKKRRSKQDLEIAKSYLLFQCPQIV